MAAAQVGAGSKLVVEGPCLVEVWCSQGGGWVLWFVAAAGGFNPFVWGMLQVLHCRIVEKTHTKTKNNTCGILVAFMPSATTSCTMTAKTQHNHDFGDCAT